MSKQPILAINDLSIGFPAKDGEIVNVISRLHARVRPGEIMAVIGSSGSGKSLLAEAILGISSPAAYVTGDIEYRGKKLNAATLSALAGNEVGLIPQSVNSLDPLMKIGPQVRGKNGCSPEDIRRIFERYQLPQDTADKYPFEISGGMARRVLIAAALLAKPQFIVADEPTPGLHAELAELIMQDLRKFADAGNGVLIITHDVELALRYADRASVFYAGTTLEVGLIKEWQDTGTPTGGPYHPYTRALLRSLPGRGFVPYPGSQPLPGSYSGCPFSSRCPWKIDACSEEIASLRIGKAMVRCANPAAYREESLGGEGK